MLKVLTIFGTRPEAIKLAPVLLELRKYPNVKSCICVTAQHRQMLDQVLNIFNIVPDIDLNLMRDDQPLADLTARVITGIDRILAEVSPDLVLIQGDTTTVMATAMAAFYRKIPVGHVEAGLRSGDINSPFPEDMNRRVAGMIASYHFAPTEIARNTLLEEGVPENKTFLTGNTVIDALSMIVKKPCPNTANELLIKANIDRGFPNRRLILVTAHRRENYGERIESICNGLKQLAKRNKNISILYPVHFNPNIRETVFRVLGDAEGIYLCDPVEYDAMTHLMNKSYFILTDSGGIQEEAPALGKPVLVTRTETERPEGVEVGTAKLIGPYSDRIVDEAERLLQDKEAYNKMAFTSNPYGDGRAASRIAKVIASINRL